MREPELSTLIAKEIGSETNRRFLSRLPGLKPDLDLPNQLSSLLERLEESEKRRRAFHH